LKVLDVRAVAVESTGVNTINQTLQPGCYLLAMNSDGAPTFRFVRISTP
jgi:hypothetical protein